MSKAKNILNSLDIRIDPHISYSSSKCQKKKIIIVDKTSAEKGSGVSEKYSCDCIRAISRADIRQVWYWFFYDYEVVFWPPLIFFDLESEARFCSAL